MAYFLRFDGVNDYVTLASTINISTTDDFSIKWRWPTTSSGNHRVLGGDSADSSLSRIIHFANGNITVYGGTGGNVGFSQATDQSIDREIELRRVAGSLSLHYDGQQQGPAQNSSQSFTFGVLGANFSTATVASDLYNIEFEVNGQAISFYDPSISNGTGSILPDTVGSNDGTLVNFPTDNSQWVFYDDGGGGVSDISPSSILPEELFGTPSITPSGISILPPSVDTEEFLVAPSVSSAGVSVHPISVSSSEAVGDAEVSPLGVNIFPATILSQESVQEPEVFVGLTVLSPAGVESEEVVPEPLLDLMLKQVLVPSVPNTFSVGRPVVVGGDRIVIPIIARTNFTKIQGYLKTLGFSGALEDTILAWLRSEGYEGQWNDAWYEYLEDLGHTGALPERLYKWKREVT